MWQVASCPPIQWCLLASLPSWPSSSIQLAVDATGILRLTSSDAKRAVQLLLVATGSARVTVNSQVQAALTITGGLRPALRAAVFQSAAQLQQAGSLGNKQLAA